MTNDNEPTDYIQDAIDEITEVLEDLDELEAEYLELRKVGMEGEPLDLPFLKPSDKSDMEEDKAGSQPVDEPNQNDE